MKQTDVRNVVKDINIDAGQDYVWHGVDKEQDDSI